MDGKDVSPLMKPIMHRKSNSWEKRLLNFLTPELKNKKQTSEEQQ